MDVVQYLVLLNNQPLLFDILARRKYGCDDDIAISAFHLLSHMVEGGAQLGEHCSIFFWDEVGEFKSSATIFAIN